MIARRHVRVALAVAWLGVGFTVLCGCGVEAVPGREAEESKPVVPAGGVLLQGAGATFPALLYQQWFHQYEVAHPDRVIAYAAVGSGEGVRRFIGQNVKDEEQVDFGASDAAMSDDEIARVQAGALLVPVTAGTVAVAYNLPDVSGDLRLSRQAYAGIFLGEIKNWNDPRITQTNPGVTLPNLTIVTVVRLDSSGTTFAFAKHLDGVNETWRSRYGAATLVDWPGNAMRATGNEGVAGRITQSIGSIGYVGYEFARRAGLRMALLENRAGAFVAPSQKSAEAALAAVTDVQLPENMRVYIPDPAGRGSYPIVTLTWILLRRTYADPRTAADLREMFRWCLTDGQQYAAGLGYIPLPPDIVSRSLATLDRVQSARLQ
jgi:phosphate transport system substrate-binding protein